MAEPEDIDSILPLSEAPADSDSERGSATVPTSPRMRSPASGIARARPRTPNRRPGMSIWPALMETLPTPVLVIDELERVALANAAMRSQLEGARLPYLGHSVEGLLDSNLLREAGRRLRSTVGQPEAYCDELKTPRGRVSVTVRVDLLSSSSGDFLCVTLEDIEDQQRRRRAHSSSHRLETLGQLTGSLAHDFNNQLSIILTSLEWARRASLGHGADKALEQATDAALRTAETVGQVLRYSRRPTGRRESVRPSAVVRELRGLFERTLARGTKLVLHADAAGEVAASLSRLETALLNLVLNARDVLGPDGRVTIATEERDVPVQRANELGLKPGYYLVLSVEDDGPGMEESVRRRASEPFFTTKPDGEGSGLGLTTAFEFAKESHGNAIVNSAPGQGTRVELWLPCVPRRLSSSPRSSLAPLSSRRTPPSRR